MNEMNENCAEQTSGSFLEKISYISGWLMAVNDDLFNAV